MAGFNSVAEYSDADLAGQCWFSQFRKALSSASTGAGTAVDYTYAAGSPPANFYASSPLVSALVEPSRGIYVPSVGAGKKQFLKNMVVMTTSTSSSSNSNGRQLLMLCDYLMYYPFIDSDALGEEQVLENTVTLPRYTSGQVIAVAQSASSAIGTFTMNYTNQDGVAKTSQVNRTFAVSGGGQVVNALAAGASYNSFVNLATGDTGVRSIESVTFTAAGGGLLALVIVKPLQMMLLSQECRRTSTGDIASLGAANEHMNILHTAGAAEIKDGAVLGFFASGMAGSLASSTLIGTLETVWN